MRREDMFHMLIIIIVIIIIAANINGINSFLSVHTDKTIEFGHSVSVVPQAWNTTEDLNLTNQSKTPDAITNGYIFIDHWDDWPEDHITAISEAKFRAMEDGGYKVLKNEHTSLAGVPVSKQYFSNPARNSDDVWNHVGVTYVFPKEDTNYAIQVHYFTSHDYNNSTFLQEVDDRVVDDISNIHNNDYRAFASMIKHGFKFISRVASNQK